MASSISRANRLNLFAICIGRAVALFKIDVESGVLELLQRIEVPGLDPLNSCINCAEWTSDNSHLAVGCDEGVLKYYELQKTPDNKLDFRSPVKLVCDLTGHGDSINRVDISAGKTLLVSVGADNCAHLFDLRQKRSIKRLTFADKEYKDFKGNPDESPFMIRGCAFSDTSLFILATKTKYSSFVVKYQINVSGG